MCFGIVLASLDGIILGLLNFPQRLQLLLFSHPLLGRQLCQLFLLVVDLSSRLLRFKGLLLDKSRVVLDVDTARGAASAAGEAAVVHEIDHFLADDGHLQDLGH